MEFCCGTTGMITEVACDLLDPLSKYFDFIETTNSTEKQTDKTLGERGRNVQRMWDMPDLTLRVNSIPSFLPPATYSASSSEL